MLNFVKKDLRSSFLSDAFNVEINIGVAAGQASEHTYISLSSK